MSDYTPTTEEVREAWIIARYWDDYELFDIDEKMRDEESAQFDRWLKQVKAEAWDEGFDAGVDNVVLKEFVFNPYTIKSERAQKYIEKRLSEATE